MRIYRKSSLAKRGTCRGRFALSRSASATCPSSTRPNCVMPPRRLLVSRVHTACCAEHQRSPFGGRTTRHPGYAISQRIRERVEEAFGWAKTVAGLRKMRHRGLPKVDWQFTLAMAAYDLVRLAKLLAGDVQ